MAEMTAPVRQRHSTKVQLKIRQPERLWIWARRKKTLPLPTQYQQVTYRLTRWCEPMTTATVCRTMTITAPMWPMNRSSMVMMTVLATHATDAQPAQTPRYRRGCVPNDCDVCPATPDPDQADSDGDAKAMRKRAHGCRWRRHPRSGR